MKENGFAPILIVILIATLAVGGYLLYSSQTRPTPPPQNPVVVSQSNQPTPTSTPEATSSADTTNWKTYSDPANLFSFEYPDFVKLTDIKAAYNESSIADINISFPISPLDTPPLDQADMIFQLSIKVVNSARKTTQQFIQESNKPNYRISSIKPYKNGEIDGIYYSVLDKTSETSANIEKIIQTRGDLFYIFEYESWNGAFVEGRGKDTVQKILSTFKFLP